MTADEQDEERSLVLKALGAAFAMRLTGELLADRAHAFAEGGISSRYFREFLAQYERRVEDHVGDAILLRWDAAQIEEGFQKEPVDISTSEPQKDAARKDDWHDGNPT